MRQWNWYHSIAHFLTQQDISELKYTVQVKYNQDLESHSKQEHKDDGFAIVDERCPKCSHIGMKYFTMQLRSADEGSTVFYECLKCR